MMDGESDRIELEDLERQLDWARGNAAGPVTGVFGPQSLSWRVDRESILFLGAARALLLQLAHPWVAAAVAEQSEVAADPIGRFHRTFDITFTLIFGSLDQALSAARRLHRRHARVAGVLWEGAGPYRAGSRYEANDIQALRWVHATLIETTLQVHDLILPPLSDAERERYYLEAQVYAALFGIPRDRLPPTWQHFAVYNEAMWRSDILTVSRAARALARRLLVGSKPWLRAPRWYRAVTSAMLPSRLREAYGLPYDDIERAAARRAIARIRRVYPALPKRVRYVAPYHEAMARLRGELRPDIATQCLNLLWIGRRRLPD